MAIVECVDFSAMVIFGLRLPGGCHLTRIQRHQDGLYDATIEGALGSFTGYVAKTPEDALAEAIAGFHRWSCNYPGERREVPT